MGLTSLFTLAFCVLEFVGGKISGSLALIADAGHMLVDLAALLLAYLASRVAQKGATARLTYGYSRIEILSALINGAALLAIAAYIVVEAWKRFHEPASVINTPLMLVVAAAGLLFNLCTAFFLHRHAHDNLNIRSAFFHVLSDTLSSIGALAAGFIILLTGWTAADPLISIGIAVLIVINAVRLLRDVVAVLLEAAPSHIDVAKLEKAILSVAGVLEVHDLHVWSITSGKESLSAHLKILKGIDSESLLKEVNDVLTRDFNITHTTIQIETETYRDKDHSCPDC